MPLDPAYLDAFLEITRTKAQYCRALDRKEWDAYADCFTEDLVLDTRPAGGALMRGRDETVRLVRGSVERAATAHQVHAPEIALDGADAADAVFAMQDRVVWDAERAGQLGNAGHTGYGQYRERYVREGDGRWRIARQELVRFHVDVHPL